MEYLAGAFLALTVSVLATLVGLDRDRAFYPIVMIVIASYYGLFAIMGGSNRTLTIESVSITGFFLVSILGFKLNLWIIVGALFAHGIFDFVHGYLISNPGVPAWWPMFCLTYEIAAAAYLAWLLKSSRVSDVAVVRSP
jgi:hypothetical protein